LSEGHENHNHLLMDRENRLKDEIKSVTKSALDGGVKKPTMIMKMIEQKNFKVPKKLQVTNYLAHYKRKKYGVSSISLGKMEEYCVSKSTIPDKDDEVFVGNFQISLNDDVLEDNIVMRIFFTTKRLIRLTMFNRKHICADATYKLIWQGYPVLIVGTTDIDRVFHPYGLAYALTSDKKILSLYMKVLQIVPKR
jgi:hypothetical protein